MGGPSLQRAAKLAAEKQARTSCARLGVECVMPFPELFLMGRFQSSRKHSDTQTFETSAEMTRTGRNAGSKTTGMADWL
jgi:hypothetical protein